MFSVSITHQHEQIGSGFGAECGQNSATETNERISDEVRVFTLAAEGPAS